MTVWQSGDWRNFRLNSDAIYSADFVRKYAVFFAAKNRRSKQQNEKLFAVIIQQAVRLAYAGQQFREGSISIWILRI